MLTAAQKRWTNLVLDAEEAATKAEMLRRKLAKTCRHPVELQESWVATYPDIGKVTLGEQCILCQRRRFVFGPSEWHPQEGVEGRLPDWCVHPEGWHRGYQWHHGYGKMVTGVECVVCRARKSFKSQGYWHKYAEWSQWRRDRDDD